MYAYDTFMRLAKESSSNEELVEKVEKNGGTAFIRNGEVFSGASDRFGYVTFSARLTADGFEVIMY
jgi:hypothetical protein